MEDRLPVFLPELGLTTLRLLPILLNVSERWARKL
jgi:hypothetical protein